MKVNRLSPASFSINRYLSVSSRMNIYGMYGVLKDGYTALCGIYLFMLILRTCFARVRARLRSL